MIRLKTRRKLYVAPEIEVTTYEEELMGITGSTPGKDGNDGDGEGNWGNNSKSGRFIIIDDFEDEEYAGDDFNYDNYKKQSMLW